MLERQCEGIAKAEAEGKYCGRKLIALDKQKEVLQLISSGMTKSKVAEQLMIGEASVYRVLKRQPK